MMIISVLGGCLILAMGISILTRKEDMEMPEFVWSDCFYQGNLGDGI